MVVTKELLATFATSRGGYTLKTISILSRGELHNWKRNCVGKEITGEEYLIIMKSIGKRNIKNELTKDKPRPKKRNRKRKDAKFPKMNYYGDVNAPEFLESFQWRSIRMHVLKRDGAKCACCGNIPREGIYVNVDHIKPRKKFPELALEPSNLQVLCNVCNHGKGNWDSTDWRV